MKQNSFKDKTQEMAATTGLGRLIEDHFETKKGFGKVGDL